MKQPTSLREAGTRSRTSRSWRQHHLAIADCPCLAQLGYRLGSQRVLCWQRLARRECASSTMLRHSSASARRPHQCRAQRHRCYEQGSLRCPTLQRVTPLAVRRGNASWTIRSGSTSARQRRSYLVRRRQVGLLTMKQPLGRCQMRVARRVIPSSTTM